MSRANWKGWAICRPGLALAGFFHMQLGMRVIIEDYIARHATRTVLLLANLFFCWGAGVLTVLAILKVALGGGAN